MQINTSACSPLVSVVVPVYNVAGYLETCVESIVAQTYTNLEIILVDDGSTDESGHLCDEIAKTDSRIMVIHKKNGGLSSARNAGTAVAKGDYIAFVDSDDFISCLFIEALLREAQRTSCDMVALPGGTVFSNGQQPTMMTDCDELDLVRVRVCDELSFQSMLLYQRCANGAPFRLYSREIAEQCLFPEGLLFEDMATLYKMAHLAGRVAYIETTALYAYRINPHGITRGSYNSNKARSVLIIAEQMEDSLLRWYPDLEKPLASSCFGTARAVFAQARGHNEDDAQDMWNLMLRYRKRVLLDAHAKKRERLAALLTYSGKTCFSVFCSICRKAGLMV